MANLAVTVAPPSFAQLVSLASHDLRTPLATASGFASTLQRLDQLGAPADRYVEMIGAATDQIAELLDLLSVAARVESGRFEAQLRPTSSRDVADAAAARLPDGAASVAGDGVDVSVDANWAPIAVGAIAEAARRHGGLQHVTLAVEGPGVTIGPVVDGAGAIAVGDDLRDFPAAVGTRVLAATGASVELGSETLHIAFPPNSP